MAIRKAAVIKQCGIIEVEEAPKDGEVLLRIEAAALCGLG